LFISCQSACNHVEIVLVRVGVAGGADAAHGDELLGSMGKDARLAILSRHRKLAPEYREGLVAQVGFGLKHILGELRV
jgi:hypothetical protein